MALEFRRLNEKESEKLQMALTPVGGTCTGASYVKATKTYYIGFAPPHQATPRLRRTLEDALGTTNIVLNGRVKV